MSETEDLRDAIARVLATTLIDEPDGNTEWLQLADAVLALPQVAELQRDAWTEGFMYRERNGLLAPLIAGNPYTAALASSPTTHESEEA